MGRRLLYRGSVEWGLGLRTVSRSSGALSKRARRPFHDFQLSPGVVWLKPILHVELTYSELMEGRLRDPVPRARLNGSQASSVRASSHMT
jgi:hypothetical protein